MTFQQPHELGLAIPLRSIASRLCGALKICLANHLPINPGNVGSPLKTSIRMVTSEAG
jgi:hypothetical protein